MGVPVAEVPAWFPGSVACGVPCFPLLADVVAGGVPLSDPLLELVEDAPNSLAPGVLSQSEGGLKPPLDWSYFQLSEPAALTMASSGLFTTPRPKLGSFPAGADPLPLGPAVLDLPGVLRGRGGIPGAPNCRWGGKGSGGNVGVVAWAGGRVGKASTHAAARVRSTTCRCRCIGMRSVF